MTATQYVTEAPRERIATTPARVGVGMLSQGFYPRVGGGERQLQTIIKPLRALGIDATVITRRYPGFAPRARIEGAKVYRVPIPGGRVVASLAYTLGTVLTLVRIRRQVQVIHAHELLSPTTTAIVAKLLLRRPVVATVLRGGELGDVKVLLEGRLGPARYWLFRQLVDAFVAVSDEIEDELRSSGVREDRIARIPFGVDLDRFKPAEAAERARIRADLGLEGKVVIFMGRLAIEKGLDYLLDAWPAITAQVPEANLLIVGDGPQGPSLRARAGADVRFVPAVDDPDRYLKAVDCFVLPSRTEGLPNALLEGMAAQLPCVATLVGGSTDAIRPGREGWLVTPGDVPALGAAIVEALTDDSAPARAAAARARICEVYSLQSVSKRLADLYRRLI